MPGRNIVFFTDILQSLPLTDVNLVSLELAARAGYDPRAPVLAWRTVSKYAQTSGSGRPPQFLSTHPSKENRIRRIEANLPCTQPLDEQKKGR